MAILRTENLTKYYHRGFWGKRALALRDLNLEVQPGEIFGFLGPNGAGKTTTLKMLLQLIYPSAGRAWIKDQPIGHPSLVQTIGYMPENPYFYRFLTGEELLHFYGKLCGLSAGRRAERARELLQMVGLGHAGNVRVGEYSKGMVQRVGLAQALLNEPELILMDEPLSGLDPIGRAEMRQVVLRLQENGKTIFFCSHILSDVEEICERAAILHRGRLVAEGKVDDMLNAEEQRIHMRVSGVTVPEPLRGSVLHEEHAGDVTDLYLTDSAAADAMVRHIGQGHGRLLSLESRRMNLEEYFVKRIREASQKEAAA